MGGAFSVAQGGRGPGGPGRGPLSSCARAHVRLLGGALVAQADFPLPWAGLLFPSAQLYPRRRRWLFLPLVCRVLRYY